MRAVRLGSALEVVTLDRALEALALGDAGDLDRVALGEGVGRDGVTDEPLGGLIAELDEAAAYADAGTRP